MPRPLVLGNGQMLINFDSSLNIRDLYFPYVGQLNHVGGHYCSFGIWADGRFAWCYDKNWEKTIGYKHESLVSDVRARHDKLEIELHINDAVHFTDNIYLKRMTVKNKAAKKREMRIFFTHDFSIDESEVGDTAVYNPEIPAIYHYKRNRYFLANGRADGQLIYEFATGIKRFGGAEGTWRDAEDGRLANNPIAQGSVDSTISFRMFLDAGEEKTLYYWLVVGRNYQEVRDLDKYVVDRTPARLLERIETYMANWVNKQDTHFANLPQNVVDQYKRSLLITSTQIDRNMGAIIAANDSDIIQFNRDHYSYMWPRDGALVAMAAIQAGYPELVTQFFYFCENSITDKGFLLHKYNPDGSVGSSWHPWVEHERAQLPIQEDETALVICALWKYYQKQKNLNFVQFCYRGFVKPAADFMMNYIDDELELPLPSYDLWEERRGVFTYTAATVYAAFQAASRFADILGEEEKCHTYAEAARKLHKAIMTHLFDKDLGRFIRGYLVKPDGTLQKDTTLESSLWALFAFDVLEPDDNRLINTMEAIEKGLWVKTEVGGIARYTDDYYFQKSREIEKVPGNPWIICTLWLAQWHIAKAKTTEDLEQAVELLSWADRWSLSSGVLSEQLHPYNGSPVSVAPLTWSHATYVATVGAYLKKYEELTDITCQW
ncbi:glycoside hydrolase family 15 protein [Dethiobacter alkaliphilus]|uniref:glycoside hydrolase family 15 protein n=1 Tax=Dethiobacter alkaliphilus TaxID=427926 RepID=UPI0022277415|nr:glycoside hydrolase family 15 protein [Dethiobacter alkaliphilus]MCW3491563.1 glycoside hydrolase family 15 protein [Dethiobacter alkaliphilus]